MKSLLTRVGLFVLVAALLGGAAGCSKKPKITTPLPAGRAGGIAPTQQIPVDPGAGFGTGTGRLGGTDGVIPTDLGTLRNGNNGLGGAYNGDPTFSEIPDVSLADKQQDRTHFASDTIYFELDKSNVRPQYAANLANVADYLKANPTATVLIEGHCDERGTEEYNRALGERRALSVRDRLLALGVNTEQIATISFGEEKPAELGQTEAAYAKNRRAEFVLLLNPGSVR
ncbi:MAG: peptidoglycan-associated lipoprotein Pal [Verrucomicrobiae bacterium]|nr:peptidoglycan-associated lipoprotein Pal [Verrucomicrobiae bacterium]